jgi:hypothetical protein
MQKKIINKVFVIYILSLFLGASILSNINVNADIINTGSLINEKKCSNLLLVGTPPKEEWNVTFGGFDYDDGYSIQQTDDSGYIIAGFTNSYGAGNWDALLIKTDSNGAEEWNRTYGGESYDRGYSVKQTIDGGYILAGCTHSFGLDNFDVWLIKTDIDGIEEWNHTFGGSCEDWGYSVQQTNDSGYMIGGYTESYGAGKSDFWLIKTDSNGIEEWNSTFGGIDYDRCFSAQQTNDNGYIMTGYTVSFDEDYTGCDVLLIKTDSNGNMHWHQTYGGSGTKNKFDMAYSVKQTSDGGYIITGDTEIYYVDKADYLLIKTDSDGKQEWCKTYGGTSADRGRFVQQTKDGGYVLTGWSFSYSITNPDIMLIKTDLDGNESWNMIFGHEEDSGDWGYSVRQTNDNGYIILGSTMPSGWKHEASSNSDYFEGTDVWLIKVESENLPPTSPVIIGPTKCKPGRNYDYTFVSKDPDGDDILYYIDWGDETFEDWFGPFESGENVTKSHSWPPNNQTYKIRAKAKDIYGAESDWGYLEIEIPRNKVKANLFFNWLLDRFQLLVRVIHLIERR